MARRGADAGPCGLQPAGHAPARRRVDRKTARARSAARARRDRFRRAGRGVPRDPRFTCACPGFRGNQPSPCRASRGSFAASAHRTLPPRPSSPELRGYGRRTPRASTGNMRVPGDPAADLAACIRYHDLDSAGVDALLDGYGEDSHALRARITELGWIFDCLWFGWNACAAAAGLPIDHRQQTKLAARLAC